MHDRKNSFQRLWNTALSLLAILMISSWHSCKEAKPRQTVLKVEEQSPPYIEILEDEALSLLDPKTQIETLASGFSWTEGTLWVPDGDFLLFSDIPNNKVYKWDPQNDTITYLFPSGFSGENFNGSEPGSNGLLLNAEGELVLMQHGDRRVAKMKRPVSDPAAEFEVLVDNYHGKRLNSPNDGVFDSQGNLYFTDPPYGLPNRMEDENKELEFQGVYCLLNSGELLLVDMLSRPNGIALSTDESQLFVAVSDPEQAVWNRYDITAPGIVGDRNLLYDVTGLIGKEGQQGLPDGMKMHSKGYLFATGPGGIWIFNPAGTPIARIHTGQKTANCALDENEQILYMAADDYLMSVSLK
ncbi:SMP-30/gluconolactonase/LRE family protein [Poritiphilus flavus]|uniref:SMP-30/gluconolactonase/LRE family protein n=1 Tax=Poritiphilus flavus TaxID=2697053 RepID=A0A6L9EC48_9FLAO|nr:SMP-30/gluconolactonase/LRE family protein [Poritiphilus flavus]NAS12310.1 SMP-30/gluconolactonase/LRE family protein [Poritiphilus flavus]